MPEPKNNETKEQFINRFMSSSEAKKDYPDEKQRLAVANSIWKNKMEKKEMKIRYCISGLKLKEDEEGLIGLVATTHPDRVGDILSLNALHQITDMINDSSKVGGERGHTRGISLFHDWIKAGDDTLDEAGFMKNARIVDLDGGHKGVEVDIEVNKYYKGNFDGESYDAERIKYEIQNDKIGGLSIEYDTNPDNIREVEYNNMTYNYIEELSEFGGAGFARSRKIANPSAVIYKEIEDKVHNSDKNIKEDIKMSEEEAKKKAEDEAKMKAEEEAKAKEKSELEQKEAEAKAEAIKVKESEELKAKELKIKEILNSKEFKSALEEIKVDKKIIKTKEEDRMDVSTLLVKEANEALAKKDTLSFKEVASEMFKASKFDEMYKKEGISFTEPKHLKVKCQGTKLVVVGKMKIKDITDTETNPSAYTQRPAEFDDLFIPGLIESFNERTDTFSLMSKEDNMNGSDYAGWTITTNQDSDLSVDPNDVTITKNNVTKLKLRTQIKEYRDAVEIADYTLWHSRAGLGDLLMNDAMKKMADLRKDINKDLFSAQTDSGTSILGYPGVAHTATYTSIYGTVRSAANRLAPDAAADTYVAVGGALTTAAVRNGLTKVETEGAERGNLMIVTSPKQRDALFELLDGQQQLFTNPDFGFSGAIRFDGVPVIPDSDCNAAQLFVIDRASSKIVMSRAPQMIGLAKVAASQSLYVVTYLAHKYELPRRIHMLATLS